jgi:hypothetical protein
MELKECCKLFNPSVHKCIESSNDIKIILDKSLIEAFIEDSWTLIKGEI